MDVDIDHFAADCEDLQVLKMSPHLQGIKNDALAMRDTDIQIASRDNCVIRLQEWPVLALLVLAGDSIPTWSRLRDGLAFAGVLTVVALRHLHLIAHFETYTSRLQPSSPSQCAVVVFWYLSPLP